MKFVIAPGAIKTEEPKMTADNNKVENDEDKKGMIEPSAMQVKIRAGWGGAIASALKFRGQTYLPMLVLLN